MQASQVRPRPIKHHHGGPLAHLSRCVMRGFPIGSPITICIRAMYLYPRDGCRLSSWTKTMNFRPLPLAAAHAHTRQNSYTGGSCRCERKCVELGIMSKSSSFQLEIFVFFLFIFHISHISQKKTHQFPLMGNLGKIWEMKLVIEVKSSRFHFRAKPDLCSAREACLKQRQIPLRLPWSL